MPTYKYKKNFIQEAIFEARFQYDQNFDLTLPGIFFEKIKDDFPQKNDLNPITITLGTSLETMEKQKTPQVPLLVARKNDMTSLVQIGPGIIVANNLKYTGWDNFSPIIKKVLKAYIMTTTPKFINRIGTRYINNFHIPVESIDISEYFNLGAHLPPFYSNLKAFDLTFISIHENKNVKFELRTKFASNELKEGESGFRFILDMDCYIFDNFIPDNFNLDPGRLVTLAKEGHDILENVFECLITDKIRALMGVEK